MANKKRKRISLDTEESVLTKCRRRCAFCYAFKESSPPDLKGQIAHINGDRSDNREENLAYLCLGHHDDYDSSTSQSKGLTQRELKHYKSRLEEVEMRRGKNGLEDATIKLECDLADTSLSPDKLVESIRQLATLKGSVIVKDTTGADTIVVTLEKEDLATLVEAADNGKLAPLDVATVTPNISFASLSYEFYPEFPVFDTFSKKDSIRIHEAARYSQSYACTPWHVTFSTYLNPHDDSLAAISFGTRSGHLFEMGEPMVVAKKTVSNWCPERPIELLESYLAIHGSDIVFKGRPPVKLIRNERYRFYSRLSSHQDGVRRTFGLPRKSSMRYHDVKVGNQLLMLYLFAITEQPRREMSQLAKSIAWF